MKGVAIKEVVLLAPKCYSFEDVNGETKSTAKGVGRTIRKTLKHSDYKDRYLLHNELKKQINRMQSFKHVIYNISQTKIALSFFENKRAWVGKNFSLPYGHHKVKFYEAVEEAKKTARNGGIEPKPCDLLQTEDDPFADINMLISLLDV
jgi:hypothetical protein